MERCSVIEVQATMGVELKKNRGVEIREGDEDPAEA